MNLSETICSELQIPSAIVSEAISMAFTRYKKIKIPKRTGGFRTVIQPSAKLKLVQYWLLKNVFEKLSVDSCAMAFRPKVSILNNAEMHQGNRYFVKVDLANFFPSLSFSDLLPLLKRWHKSSKPDWPLDAHAITLITRACFDTNQRLPIGYPTSPVIANAILFKIDGVIRARIEKQRDKLGNVTYTRYADDLVFSTDMQGVSKRILALVHSIFSKSKSPALTINPQKTRISSSSSGSAFITGLRICADGHITLHRKHKDRVRLLLSLFKKKTLDDGDLDSLRGHLSHIKSVDPTFFTKLSERYFQEISRLLPPKAN